MDAIQAATKVRAIHLVGGVFIAVYDREAPGLFNRNFLSQSRIKMRVAALGRQKTTPNASEPNPTHVSDFPVSTSTTVRMNTFGIDPPAP